jgi:ABC-type lipoprotein export system ATPase subunit
MTNTALVFDDVSYWVGQPPNRKQIIERASFHVDRGEVVALVGPSGCGKTTILNLATGLLRPERGTISTLGVTVSQAEDTVVASLRAEQVGFVFQTFHLLPNATALQNVFLPAYFGRTLAREKRSRAEELLERVGLSPWKEVSAIELSEGQRQRVAIARALLTRPALVFADEPTGNLDDESARTVLNLLISEVKRERGTLFIATHDRRCLALVDRTMVMASATVTPFEDLPR